MKIRNGFISNSSTCSFIILVRDKHFVDKDYERALSGLCDRDIDFIATKKEIEKLKEYGFRPTKYSSPFDFENNNKTNIDMCYRDDANPEGVLKRYISSLAYWDSCNQNFVIYFLVKNRIPFRAAVHYGNVYWSYKRNSEHILVARNFGLEIDMYGEDHFDVFKEFDNEMGVRKIDVKEWLEEEEKWTGEDTYKKIWEERKELTRKIAEKAKKEKEEKIEKNTENIKKKASERKAKLSKAAKDKVTKKAKKKNKKKKIKKKE